MSTPIIEVWDGVLCLPILGLVDRKTEVAPNRAGASGRPRAAAVHALKQVCALKVVAGDVAAVLREHGPRRSTPTTVATSR